MSQVRLGLVIVSGSSRRGQAHFGELAVVIGDLVMLPVLLAAWALGDFHRDSAMVVTVNMKEKWFERDQQDVLKGKNNPNRWSRTWPRFT